MDFSIENGKMPKILENAEILPFLIQKGNFSLLYLLLCIGIGKSFFTLAGEIETAETQSPRFVHEALVLKGEIASLKEEALSLIKQAEELFSFDMNEIYSSFICNAKGGIDESINYN